MLGTAAGQVEVHGVYMGRHMGQRGRSLRSFCRRWGACVRRRITTLLAPRFQGTHLLGRRPMPGAGGASGGLLLLGSPVEEAIPVITHRSLRFRRRHKPHT